MPGQQTPRPAEDGTAALAARLRVTGGSPDTAELAAVTAVLTAALDELANEDRRRAVRGRTQWEASQRSLRGAVTTGSWTWFGRR